MKYRDDIAGENEEREERKWRRGRKEGGYKRWGG